MKRYRLHYVFAAAALAAVAHSASAQVRMKAEIPFTFHAGQALLAPGAYEVKLPEGASPIAMLRNIDTGKAVMVVYSNPEEPGAKGGASRLSFVCASGRCVLRHVWPGGAARGYTFRGPKLPAGEAVIAREVPLTRVNTN